MYAWLLTVLIFLDLNKDDLNHGLLIVTFKIFPFTLNSFLLIFSWNAAECSSLEPPCYNNELTIICIPYYYNACLRNSITFFLYPSLLLKHNQQSIDAFAFCFLLNWTGTRSIRIVHAVLIHLQTYHDWVS